MKPSRYLVWEILVLSFFALLVLFSLPRPVAGGANHTPDEPTLSMLVTAYEDKVALLKWIGGAVITSLAGAVALLYRNNLRNQDVIVNEIKAVADVREKVFAALAAMTQAITLLSEKIDHLPNPEGTR